MSDQSLELLFESEAKVKLLKLFLRNDGFKFTASEVRSRAQIDISAAKSNLEKLRLAGFLKSYSKKEEKIIVREVRVVKKEKNKKPKISIVKRRRKKEVIEKVYFINPHFVFFNELRDLVLKSSPASKSRILSRSKGLGRVKMLVLSGIFLRVDRQLSRTDLLMVADDVSEKRFQKFLRHLEAEVGCEIQFSLMSSDEFYYRHKMLDRFLRDILERPHEVLINKLGAL
ncbi:MAG: hypothetical protein A3B96_04000 [Candidatus Spechtbacteria bacterium RIFCSPHIGHO2_02_FULL_43_15b]|uniref:Transcriptional regulator n=1 Tax=Candidatus Spechtbacteria bacterium RIFCSPHIGHO2_01_FULL_43_30 TaxID=1802158 RepID=A0A1G2H7Y8_9BACT|nr:MAG: hypothetical protein A2827_00005 [Candidatus Spechtbacteria bacterium RIFCSPHIGHO2_01_FULL_43_30]OGZ60385.1 MAG: hypothetical protein A3B96_04000 [Candidatus Spechtbacteria bacterium RIFCSPHIGHO2_02_FULL_43_15b]